VRLGRRSSALRIAALQQSLALVAAVAALGLGVASPAARATEAARRVLPPGAAAVVKAAFSELPDGLRFDGAELSPELAKARVCRQDGQCATLTLSDPGRGCDTAAAGPWCVTLEGAALTEAEAAAIRARLAGVASGAVWQNASDDRRGGAEGGAGTGQDAGAAAGPTATREALPSQGGPGSTAWAWLTALAVLLVPWLLGRFVVGRLLLRGPPRGKRAPVALRLVPLLALVAGAGAVLWGVRFEPRLPLYDGLLAALLFATGLAGASSHHSPRRTPRGAMALMAGLLVLGLGAVEWVARRLPPPPPVPPAAEMTLSFDAFALEGACKSLYPDQFPEMGFLLHRSEADGRPRVLHLGDSMVTSASIGDALPAPDLLEELDKARHHIGAGVSGTSTDFQLALARSWLERASFSLVVLHLFSGNDIVELDRPYLCADAGPLLDAAGQTRFERPTWRYPLAMLAERTPAPYPLRVLATVSVAAAHLVSGFSVLTHRIDSKLGLETEGQLGTDAEWARFGALLRALSEELARRGVPLVVTVLPHRAFLEAEDPAAVPTFEAHNRMVAMARALGLETLDAGELFAEARREHPEVRYFADTTDYDVHFSPAGHGLYARWLLGRLD
jgi:hypothetical protein